VSGTVTKRFRIRVGGRWLRDETGRVLYVTVSEITAMIDEAMRRNL